MPFQYHTLSETLTKHNTKIKIYPDGSTNITYCKSAIFKEKGWEPLNVNKPDFEMWFEPEKKADEITDSHKKTERDRTDELLRLKRDKVRDIVLMNEFTHFLTITIDPQQLDSYDVKAVMKKLRNWLSDRQKRKGLQYILIPEYHKSGRIHAHALVNDVLKLVDSGKRIRNAQGEKIIYNCPEWKYGFTTAIPLDDNKMRIANYVTKYLTKGNDKIFGKYYWSSKNIQREPQTILTDTAYDEIPGQEFKPLQYNDDLSFKYESSFAFLDKRTGDSGEELATELDYRMELEQLQSIIWEDGKETECADIADIIELLQANS